MEIVNHEYYVSLEIAKLLKKAGFKWFINSAYRDGVLVYQKNLLSDNFNGKRYENTSHYEFFSAPTLDIAQRWLREVKNIWVEVLLVNAADPHYRVDLVNASRHNNPYGIIHDADYKEYETPEQAQEAGIKKALEVILEKGE